MFYQPPQVDMDPLLASHSKFLAELLFCLSRWMPIIAFLFLQWPSWIEFESFS